MQYPYSGATTIQKLLSGSRHYYSIFLSYKKESGEQKGWHSQQCARDQPDMLRSQYVSLTIFHADEDCN